MLEIENKTEFREGRTFLTGALQSVIAAEEEERKRIARGLSDETCQALNAVLASLDFLYLSKSLKSPEIKRRVKHLWTHLMDTVQSVHEAAERLCPTVLYDLGLEAATCWLLEKHLQPQGIYCQLRVEDNFRERLQQAACRLPWTTVESVLFRVLQEAVRNIAKHAVAQKVAISLGFTGSSLVLAVNDDGRGFDMSRIDFDGHSSADGHLGLLGMYCRIASLEGTLSLFSAPGKGTALRILVPL